HHNRQALLDNAEAMGFNREEVEALLREWGLMPSLVSTTYNMAGISAAREQVQLMLDQIEEIPPEAATEIQALIDQGKYNEAIAYLDALQNPIDVPVRPYLTRTMVYAQGVVSTSGDRVSMRMAARGAYLDQPEVLMAGEAGPEVILPLTDKKRMAELLGMPQVGPAVWAAMS